jgi:hypothetical protein
MIENSAKGENWMFKNLFAENEGKEVDILKNGKLSCAAFVSSLLYLFGLINNKHATVEGTVRDLISNSWTEIDEPVIGAVILWEKKDFEDGKLHAHIGFYIGDNQAVSNSSFNKGVPVKHHYTYDGTRKIEKLFWHHSLDE